MNKMFASLVMVLSLSVPGFAAEQGAQMMHNNNIRHHGMETSHPRCYKATGVVRKIDRDNGIVTLFYDAVPALMWPPMTMPFAVRDDALFERLTVGERVEFEFVLEARTGVVISVK